MMFLNLDKHTKEPLYEQVYRKIKENILEGHLESREKLPSKRQLKADLSVSMTTVEKAYGQLIDEDLIYSREKSGYFVSTLDTLHVTGRPAPNIIKTEKKTYALPLGSIDTSIVQNDIIKQISKEVFMDETLLNQGRNSGEPALKSAILDYLHINRGVNASLDQVFIGPSTEYLLDQVLFLLNHPDITIEDPGYPMIKNVLNRLNLPYDIAGVEHDGIDVTRVQALNNTVVHVTPSHQFPGGTVLSLRKRIQLLNHAAVNHSYIIEDDYDSEFRYTGKPLSSLQGLDQSNRAIYMNTFSKSVYPSLRLAVMVLPEALAEKYYASDLSCNVSRHMQHIVARFIEGRYLERHVNRMRKIYGEKMKDITEWLKHHYPEVMIQGAHTGMHFIVKIPGYDITEHAQRHTLLSLNQYAVQNTFKDSIIVGTGENTLEETTHILGTFLDDVLKK